MPIGRHCPPIPDKRVGTENLTEKKPWLSYIREWILNIKKIPALSITLLCPLRISQKVSVHKRSKLFILRLFFVDVDLIYPVYPSDEIRFFIFIFEKWFHNHFVALVGCVDRDTHEFKPGGTDAIHDGLGVIASFEFLLYIDQVPLFFPESGSKFHRLLFYVLLLFNPLFCFWTMVLDKVN